MKKKMYYIFATVKWEKVVVKIQDTEQNYTLSHLNQSEAFVSMTVLSHF